jgi:hypothetical protein
MLASSIVSLLIVSGVITAVAGLGALLLPRPLLRLGFGVPDAPASTMFFARHWGLLIMLFGALLIVAAGEPALRGPVMLAAAIEKIAIGVFVFFGPLKRTAGMTLIAVADAVFAVLYLAYLAGP